MSEAAPRVAVCVPVYADAERLERLLAAVAAGDWPTEATEVIVGVDGMDPACQAVARRHGARVVGAEERRGSYATRNAALAVLGDDVTHVAFIDADCIPSRQWLRAHVAALDTADLSGGAVDVTLRDPASPAEFVDRSLFLQQEGYVRWEGFAATANLAVRRSVVDAIQFDGSLQSNGDREFCHRATSSGCTLVYSPEAVVEHPARQTVREVLAKTRRITRGMTARPDLWRSARRPIPLPRRSLVRHAHDQGVSRGLLWDAAAVTLELVCQWWIFMATRWVNWRRR